MPRMDNNKIHYCPVGLIQRQFGIYVTGAGIPTMFRSVAMARSRTIGI